MNAQLKTVLLTVLTLSALTIAIIELTGISRTALWNKFGVAQEVNLEGLKQLEAHNHFQDSVAGLPKTKISFAETHFDFGKIKEGDKVRHTYTFTNTGSNPLIISDAIPSCGCTIPSFSRKPIAPGAQGSIEVEFNSANRQGANHKNIIIVSNADRDKVSISFDAMVE